MRLFKRDQSVISRHLRNVFSEGELEEKSNMQKMHIANTDKTIVKYNLDVIVSVGYRVNSKYGYFCNALIIKCHFLFCLSVFIKFDGQLISCIDKFHFANIL